MEETIILVFESEVFKASLGDIGSFRTDFSA